MSNYSLRAVGVRFKHLLNDPLTREFKRKHPSLMMNLQQYLKQNEAPETRLNKKIDIGLPPSRPKRSEFIKHRLATISKNRKDPVLEQLAKDKQLKIDIDGVTAEWKENHGSNHIKVIAEHYGIFDDLFKHAYFNPSLIMDINYPVDDEVTNPVYRGNIIFPSETSSAPNVSFESKPDQLWTLILTSLDSHLLKDGEYMQWMVGNIPGGDLSKGETICDYMQPIPAKGTGYHRLVFVLYQQTSKIDYSSMQKKSPCYCLQERTFKTFDFYKSRQEVLTPAGLSFFQSTWDESLKDFFNYKLNMKEPIFEYEHPVHTFKAQTKYPHLKPFNFYLDHHRDPKEINQEVLSKRLKNLDPFTPEAPEPKYPQVHPIKGSLPSWYKVEVKKARGKVGKYSHL